MSAASEAPALAPPQRIAAAPRSRRVKELAFRVVMLACLGAGLLVLAVLFVDVLRDGLGQIDVQFLTSFASSQSEIAGIEAAILGTLWLMALCAIFIVPVGVATAIYLEEYADSDRWWNRMIDVNIQNLAAVPSVVYGILGLAFLVRGPLQLGFVVVAGAITLGLLVLPVVIITARESIRSVPPSIREGALALGATQWQTIRKQVLPAAVPGIATGVILALSRAIGETAPLVLVGGASYIAFNPNSLDDRYTALPLQIFTWIKLPQEDFQALAAGAILVLLVVLLSMNAVAIVLRNRFENKW